MAGLQQIVRQRILKEVVGLRKDAPSYGGKLQWKVLIVDDLTLKVVSSCLTMAQLATEAVSNVEHMHKHREPNRLAEAIYFVAPNEKSVKAILEDIKFKFYSALHVLFTEECPKPLLNNFLSKVTHSEMIKSCKEVYLSFIPLEKLVYSISMKPILPPLETSSSADTDKNVNEFSLKLMDQMAAKLATLCNSFEGTPSIGFQKDCSYTDTFAQILRDKLNSIKDSVGTNQSSWNNTSHSHYQVLILDRGFDLISCLIHDMTYQSMAYDLLGGGKLDVEKNTYNLVDSNASNQAHQLDNSDAIWEELKHEHIASVLDKIARKVKDERTKEDQKGAKEESEANTKKLKRDVQELLTDKKRRRELKIHSDLAHILSETIEFKKIKELCEVEQALATASRSNGFLPVDSKQESFTRLILDKDIDEVDKIRLICMHILSKKGIPEQKLTNLIGSAQNINQANKIIFKSLFHYGCKVSADAETNVTDAKNNISVPLHNRITGRPRNNPYSERIGTEWTPVLKDILGKII